MAVIRLKTGILLEWGGGRGRMGGGELIVESYSLRVCGSQLFDKGDRVRFGTPEVD